MTEFQTNTDSLHSAKNSLATSPFQVTARNPRLRQDTQPAAHMSPLRVAKVAAAIEVERGRLRERIDLVADDVVHGLRRLAEDPNTPASARVQAWRLLGRNLGLFADKVEVEHNVRVPELAGIPLSELVAMRETLVKALPEPVEVEVRVLDN